MTAKAFDRVAQDFMFPATALHVLANNGGILTRSLIPSSQAPNLVPGIQITIKAWQNSAIGNFGLVMSFDVKTRTTSAFLHGTGVTNGAGFEQLCVLLRQSSPAGLSHPLLLPSILLWQHVRRMQPVVVKFEDAVIDAEGQLVVRSGRHRTTPVVRRKENFEQLTRNIYTVLTDILFVKHCCDWQKSLERFLSDILETASHDGWTSKSSEFTRYLHKNLLAETQWLNEGIANLASETTSMASLLEQLRTRIEKQPEVMYNRVNANMAVTSIKDNTTMKTLAVIAAVFPPGTYIATVFSMSMFDWQLHKGDNSSSSSRMISSNFWIYWAVSIPLTVLVITLGWLFWTWNQNRSARLVMDDIKAMEQGLPRRRNSPTRDNLSPMDRIAVSKAKGDVNGRVVAGAPPHAKPEAYELVLTLQGWKAASLIRTRGQALNAQAEDDINQKLYRPGGQGSSLGIPARGGATAADSSKTKKTSSYWDDEDM